MNTFTVIRTNHPNVTLDARDLKQATNSAVSQYSDVAEVRSNGH